MVAKHHPNWMNWTLKAAAIYNVAFALMTLVAPFWIFDVTGAARPNYPELWQCIGMIVGVYGLGYWVASYDPMRHWPIVLVGWLGKTFGPIGFAKALWDGVFPLSFGWTIVFNDLIWWWPFAVMVFTALDRLTRPALASVTGEDKARFNDLTASSAERPVLMLFLRHAGCTFCREMLSDLSRQKDALVRSGARVVIVHMGDDRDGAIYAYARTVGLPATWEFVSDPGRSLYQLAEVSRGTLWQIFSPRVFWRGVVAGIFAGHGVGPIEGDGFMMPAARVWNGGKLIYAWSPNSAADKLPIDRILDSISERGRAVS